MTLPDIDKLDHDPELAEALGNMIVAWARAETALANVMHVITGMHFNLACAAYYRIPTFDSRVKVILSLIDEWQVDQAKRDLHADAVEKLRRLSGARNSWVHSIWAHDDAANKTLVFDFRMPSSKDRRIYVKAHDVKLHTETVRKRTKDLEALSPLKLALKP